MNEQTQIARCGWCGEIVGHREPGGFPFVSRFGHMRDKHSILWIVAHFLSPYLKGDMLTFPINWESQEKT